MEQSKDKSELSSKHQAHIAKAKENIELRKRRILSAYNVLADFLANGPHPTSYSKVIRSELLKIWKEEKSNSDGLESLYQKVVGNKNKQIDTTSLVYKENRLQAIMDKIPNAVKFDALFHIYKNDGSFGFIPRGYHKENDKLFDAYLLTLPQEDS